MAVSKQGISVDERKCTGCRVCQLICSLNSLGLFNPLESNIRVYNNYFENTANAPFEIKILDSCTSCRLCVQYCPYGALS